MSTTDTTSVSHLGETIAIPDFWTALLLVFPNGTDIMQANGAFNSIPSVVGYAHPNYLAQLFSVPDDSLYNQQLSIHSSTAFPGSDINVSEAWDVIHNGGQPFIRGGVFDIGLDWQHRDFGYDGTNAASSKIAGGWDFINQVALKNLTHGDDAGQIHATAVTGIIAAQRNNHRGIAGIAGGNDSTGSKGVSMYGLTLFSPSGQPISTATSLSYISNAMLYASQSPTVTSDLGTKRYCFNVNFQNHSWGLYIDTTDNTNISNVNLLSDVMHSINRLKVTAVAARGNDHATIRSIPANVDDDWVINVTGTGTNGQFAHNTSTISGPFNAEFTSGWGGDVDLGAPSTSSLILSLSTPFSTTIVPEPQYEPFSGTSAAAPHVSGAVGLMLSYINDTTYNYKNMAPEDCEAILQLSATDTDSTGYDQLTGHGRLNVGKAMKLLEKPYHRLRHFGTNSQFPYTVNKSLYSTIDTVRTLASWQSFSSPMPWHLAGKYVIKTYKITSTIYHSINNQDTILASWPRPSSCATWPMFTTNAGVNYLLPHEKTKITNIDNSSATLEGYIYQVKSAAGVPLGWWPVDTAYVGAALHGYWAEYSVLTRNYSSNEYECIRTSTSSLLSLSVYPNPTSGSQTIDLETNKVCDLTVELSDIMGRKLKTLYSGKSEPFKTRISHNLSALPNSLYIYNINIDGVVNSRKFIKQ